MALIDEVQNAATKVTDRLGLQLDGTSEVKTWIGSVPIDAAVRRVYTQTATVTRHPVEGDGVDDHVIDDPDELQIEGVISNTPAAILDALRSSPNRAENAYEELWALKTARRAITVITGKRAHENMVITSVVRTDDGSSGESEEDALVRTLAAQQRQAEKLTQARADAYGRVSEAWKEPMNAQTFSKPSAMPPLPEVDARLHAEAWRQPMNS